MSVKKCMLLNSNVNKQRLLFKAVMLNFVVNQKRFLSKVSEEASQSAKINSILNTSLKPYLNTSKLHLLQKYFTPKSDLAYKYTFVFDEDVAKDIVKKILERVDIKSRFFLELNPALGLITLNLIKSGVPFMCLIDNNEIKALSLSQILKKHSDKLKHIKANISSNQFFFSVFDEAAEKNQILTLIGVKGDFLILRSLVITFLKNGFWRCPFEIYLIITSSVWENSKKMYKKHFKFVYFCAFHVLFHAEKIASYPQSAFLPTLKNNSDYSLIRISLNKNFLKNLKEEDLLYFVLFLNVLGSKPNDFIIPTLEKWLPDCGPYLIYKGISMTNKIEHLTPEEVITLFNIFKECEGYNHYKIFIKEAFENTIVM